MAKQHYVYKYVFNGEIVYIGKTNSTLSQRLYDHSRDNKFQPYINSDVYIAKFKNSAETDVMEKLLIDKYKPVLNVTDKFSESIGISFTEPVWNHVDEIKEEQATPKKRRPYNREEVMKKRRDKEIISLVEYYLCTLELLDTTMAILEVINGKKDGEQPGDEFLIPIPCLCDYVNKVFTEDELNYIVDKYLEKQYSYRADIHAYKLKQPINGEMRERIEKAYNDCLTDLHSIKKRVQYYDAIEEFMARIKDCGNRATLKFDKIEQFLSHKN